MKRIDDREFTKSYGKMSVEKVAEKFGCSVSTVVRKAGALGVTHKQKTMRVKKAVERQVSMQIWVNAEIEAQKHLDLYQAAKGVVADLKAISMIAKEKVSEARELRRNDNTLLRWMDKVESLTTVLMASLLRIEEFEQKGLARQVANFKQAALEALKDENPEVYAKIKLRLIDGPQLAEVLAGGLSSAGRVDGTATVEPEQRPNNPDGQQNE